MDCLIRETQYYESNNQCYLIKHKAQVVLPLATALRKHAHTSSPKNSLIAGRPHRKTRLPASSLASGSVPHSAKSRKKDIYDVFTFDVVALWINMRTRLRNGGMR